MKYYGNVGFVETTEDEYGVFTSKTTVRPYYGDILSFNSRWDKGESINDNIEISNKISILSDPFSLENFLYMKYIEFAGAKWEIKSVELKYPRLILNVGGVYNEQQT